MTTPLEDAGNSSAASAPAMLAAERARFLALHAALTALDPAAPPAAHVACRPDGPLPRRLGVLAGSFNPVTEAHLALARQALRPGGLDEVWFALSVRTVDKEVVTGLCLEDRLLLLERLLAAEPAEPWGIVLLNRGLYVDQAAALRARLPDLSRLDFIVGWDKIVQIFDPRYYADRDATLDRLFRLAGCLVAPRDGAGPDALAALLARPENARWAGRVRPLPLDPAYRTVSSSQARAAGPAGHYADLVPPAAAAWLAAVGAFASPGSPAAGRYAARVRTLHAAAKLQAVGQEGR